MFFFALSLEIKKPPDKNDIFTCPTLSCYKKGKWMYYDEVLCVHIRYI